MTKKMTFWGIGPKYTILSLLYCSLTVGLSMYFNPFFKIPYIPDHILAMIGTFLILIGIPFYIISIVTIKRAFQAGRLLTDGPFGMCRHPVYSAWIVFFVPGIMLLINTWIGLSAPLAMYVFILLLVKEEEIYLERVFGDDYLAYKERIPLALPIGWLKS